MPAKPLAQRVKLIRHRSAAGCMSRMFNLRAATFVKGELGDVPATDAVRGVERMGYWGFADPRHLRIHFWLRRASLSELMMFFGHELGHVYDERRSLRKMPKGYSREEWSADAWGEVAQQAYRWANKYGSKRKD